MNKNFDYEIIDDFDKVFDEKGNSFLALRKIDWGGRGTPKLELRKWFNNAQGEETIGKGFSFLTEEGPHELTKVLLENGFGHTDEVIESIKDRDDFMSSLSNVLSNEELNTVIGEEKMKDISNIDSYYDPSEALFE